MAVHRLQSQRPAPRGGGRQRRVLNLCPVPAGRLWAVYLLMAAGLGGLAIRLAWVQVVQGPELLDRARAVQTQTITPLGRRRTIVDRQGSLVALDEERFTLWAHPRYFAFPGDDIGKLRSPLDVARKLSSVLALPMADLLRTMEGRKSGVKLASDLDPETAQRVRELGISGIDLEPYPQRVYPQGNLFANVVGFLNLERVPQAGLEQSRNSDLRRHEATRQLRRGADGNNCSHALWFAGHLRQIETFVLSPSDQHNAVECTQRHACSMWTRCLRVVKPAHSIYFRNKLDSMWCIFKML